MDKFRKSRKLGLDNCNLWPILSIIVKVMGLAARLKQLRNRLGLTLPVVHERSGIAVSSLSEFENDKREPSVSQLQKLADVYEVALTSLFDAAPVANGLLLWRDRPASPTDNQIQARFEKLCKQYLNLENWTGEFSGDSFEELFIDSFPGDYPAVERMAHEIGKKMGLGERPGDSLLRVLEEVYGVKVFHLDLGHGVSSACTISDSFGPAILLNRNSKPWRRIFDLGHELFHLVTWKARQAVDSVASEKEEKRANVFASRILLPDEPFRDAIEEIMDAGKVSYDDMDGVAREFGVSLEAICWRIKSVYRTPSEKIREMIEAVKIFSELPERSGDVPSEFPHRYNSLAVKALRRGEISSAKFADYVGINISEVSDYSAPHVPAPVEIAISNT